MQPSGDGLHVHAYGHEVPFFFLPCTMVYIEDDVIIIVNAMGACLHQR